MQGADFAGWSWAIPSQAPAANPVVDFGFDPNDVGTVAYDKIGLQHWLPGSIFSLSSSTITRFNNQDSGFRDSELTIAFSDPVDPGHGFALYYSIIPSPGAVGEPGFTAFLTPIPEPATLALLGVGGIALARR